MRENNERNQKINRFKNLCNMSQKDLKNKLTETLKEIGYQTVHKEDGFVFAQGNIPVLLVAHMDTVHKRLPSVIFTRQEDNKTTLSSPNGIGGDDRCGVFMVLEMVKELNCPVLFTEDEEIGGIGVDNFIKSPYVNELKVNYIIEFDRANANDAVFYYCENPDFTEFITQEFFHEAYGSYTDIVDLAPVLGVAAVNLSCGYYRAHTTSEYVVWEEMMESIRHAKEIVKRDVAEPFVYMEDEYFGAYKYENDWYDWNSYGFSYARPWKEYQLYYIVYYDKGNQTMAEVEATNGDAALLDFLMCHDTVPYKDIVTVLAEHELINYGNEGRE